jgi:hypothetical protein
MLEDETQKRIVVFNELQYKKNESQRFEDKIKKLEEST